ncbi:Oidioi.mRNA.OKI2018_I69.chr1.g336.t2.cds [Oikopleura dioica]|uniref:Beta-1,4-galactosyltransferase n=1 Tax=Oikopleura dioica TaxID=34765 RepID=A0ABN7SJJ0_OIKDI|nr:Oidioi.mRNA.OKI2018_I69.chr1.g336.t2.cds [Oikopleura dioica]
MKDSANLTIGKIFYVLVFFQFPLLYIFHKGHTIPFYASYDGNYYKTLVKELSSDVWEFINEDQNKLASIQTFVMQLQSKNEGIKDAEEYELVKDTISSYLIDTALEDVTNNIFHLPKPEKTHDYPENWQSCLETPPKLRGQLEVDLNQTAGPKSFSEIATDSPALKSGGHWSPAYCKAKNRVAIVIPYRNREIHLRYFLMYMHKTLQRQELDYQIFVVNQVDDNSFNRAKLLNVGFVEAMKQYDWQCFVFHDVDLVLENDKCLYRCPEMPRHISVAIDKFKYKLLYAAIFGGITSMTTDQYIQLNGYSNLFWGWGGEDDDMFNRIRFANMKILRPPPTTARFKMIKHDHESSNKPNPKRFSLLKNSLSRMSEDGLNSLEYTVKAIHKFPTHTMIDVDLGNDGRPKAKVTLQQLRPQT